MSGDTGQATLVIRKVTIRQDMSGDTKKSNTRKRGGKNKAGYVKRHLTSIPKNKIGHIKAEFVRRLNGEEIRKPVSDLEYLGAISGVRKDGARTRSKRSRRSRRS